MTWIIGQNCHIKLSHALVNGGQPAGFLLDPESRRIPQGVEIERQVFTDGTGTRAWVHFDVLLAAGALNPDGSAAAADWLAQYDLLMRFMEQQGGLSLEMPSGVLLGLGAIGYTSREKHYPECIVVKCQVNNAGFYVPPVNPLVLYGSVWDGELAWGEAVWRPL